MYGKRVYALFGLTIILVLILANCGSAETPSEEGTAIPVDSVPATPAPDEPVETPQTEPVTLRVGWLEPVDCWNPYALCESYYLHADLVADFFMAFGSTPNCDAEPRLYESWEIAEDGLSVTYNLFDGITFSDGTPVDAQAVVEFLEWTATSFPEFIGIPTVMEAAEVLDKYTFLIKTSVPVGRNFVEQDGTFNSLEPLHIWGELTIDEIFTFDPYPPIGTGPYTLTEWEPGSYLILDAREDYHRGKPPIDRIIVQIFTNADALLSSLRTGDIDLSQAGMPPETYDILVEEPNITVEERVAVDKYDLNFNVYPYGIKHKAIEDPVIREAIDYAINRQQLIDVALLGHGVLCPTNWACAPNGTDQVNPDLTVTPYDPDRAIQLLDGAGYLDNDGDGIRETTDGSPLEFRLFYELEDPPQITIADLLSGFMREIGIALDVQAMEYGEMSHGVLSGRDFDMVLIRNWTDSHATGKMDWFDTCWSADAGDVGRNFPGYCNEEVDELIYEAWYAIDEDVFTESLFKAQAIIYAERPYITLAGINRIQAYRNDHFEFPSGTCHANSGGMYSYLGIMEAIVK
jgi:peptide/nickel transport system substrate-binding protein